MTCIEIAWSFHWTKKLAQNRCCFMLIWELTRFWLVWDSSNMCFADVLWPALTIPRRIPPPPCAFWCRTTTTVLCRRCAGCGASWRVAAVRACRGCTTCGRCRTGRCRAVDARGHVLLQHDVDDASYAVGLVFRRWCRYDLDALYGVGGKLAEGILSRLAVEQMANTEMKMVFLIVGKFVGKFLLVSIHLYSIFNECLEFFKSIWLPLYLLSTNASNFSNPSGLFCHRASHSIHSVHSMKNYHPLIIWWIDE